MENNILTNRKTKKYNISSKSAYTSTKYLKYQNQVPNSESNIMTKLVHHHDGFKPVVCPKCNGKLVIHHDKNLDHYYECVNCQEMMEFSEYQKRFINLNWPKEIKNGVTLYSWDGVCPNCNTPNPFLSYCINENFGTEELCEYEPILLGKIAKLDLFIMRFCKAINLFPNKNGVLTAHIFCSKCDAPLSYENLVNSFLSQKALDVEYVIKKELLQTMPLLPEDITKSLNYLVLLDPVWSK